MASGAAAAPIRLELRKPLSNRSASFCGKKRKCKVKTSPAPNYEEACAAESRPDFSHKLSICLKELRESRCWIRLIIKTDMLTQHRMVNCWMNAISSAISLGGQS